MGTLMAQTFANVFMENFEQNLLRDYSKKIRLSPFVWFRFIDDIFFTWTGNKDSVGHFISFTQNYSKSQNINLKLNLQFISSLTKFTFLM